MIPLKDTIKGLRMKFIDYLQNITDSEEEFIEIVKEMNSWYEKNENRTVHMPHNLHRFNFTREEYKRAFAISEKALQNRKTDSGDKQILSRHGESESSCDIVLFW